MIEQAWQTAVKKIREMSNESILAVWAALGTEAAWGDGYYNEHITLDEWANLIYCELSDRKLLGKGGDNNAEIPKFHLYYWR